MNWTPEQVADSRACISQYGKVQIWSEHGKYLWNCWCDHGYFEDSWAIARYQLEYHMWSGLHS